jgi:hypothetical protein
MIHCVGQAPRDFGMVTRVVRRDQASIDVTGQSRGHITIPVDWPFLFDREPETAPAATA